MIQSLSLLDFSLRVGYPYPCHLDVSERIDIRVAFVNIVYSFVDVTWEDPGCHCSGIQHNNKTSVILTGSDGIENQNSEWLFLCRFPELEC